MATSPTSKSALKSGAAKDDTVGNDGDFTFTIADLLANDPGGAAKVNVGTQFFFGDSGDAANRTPEAQAAYLDAHGIVDNHDGTYTITGDALDFNYFVQIGNKGTWSTAHVDVVDTPDAPPPPVKHDGALLFSEDFDSYADVNNLDHGSWETVNLTLGPQNEVSSGHSWAIKDANGQWAGVSGEVVHDDILKPTSGDFWLDTQNSPGGIDITNWFVDPNGGEFRLSFDLGIHDFGSGPQQETDPNATFDIKVDGVTVDTLSYQEVFDKALAQTGQGVEQMGHFSYVIDGGNAGAETAHNISFVDTTASTGNYVGFALDTVQVHDWLI